MENPFLQSILIVAVGGMAICAVWLIIASLRSRTAGQDSQKSESGPGDNPQRSGLIVIDANAQPLFIDEISLELLGLEPSQIGGQTASDMFRKLDELVEPTSLTVDGRLVRVTPVNVSAAIQRVRAFQISTPADPSTGPGETAIRGDLIEPFASFCVKLEQVESRQDLIRFAIEGLLALLPADVIEINLFDELTGTLIPHRGFSEAHSSSSELFKGEVYRLGEGYTGWLLEHNTSLRIAEILERTDIQPKIGVKNFPYHSYLGTPIGSGEEVFGTIELAAIEANSFNKLHESILESSSAQIAYVLRHFDLERKHFRSEQEYDGLLELFAKIPDDFNHQSLNAVLTEELARLVNASFLGIYMYDPVLQTLDPFGPPFGLPEGSPHLNQKVESPPDGLLASIWMTQDFWLSNDAPADSILDSLGMGEIFQEEGFNQILIVPLSAGDERIGIILAAKKDDERVFHPDDTHMLLFFGARYGSLIQVSRAIERTGECYPASSQPSEDVDHRPEGLLGENSRSGALIRIASELSASLDLDHVLSNSLSLIQEVIPAQQGAILLISEDSDKLILRASFGSQEKLPPGGRLSPYSSSEGLAGWVIQNRHATIIDDLSEDERWVPYDDEIPHQNSALVVPLIAGNNSVGAIILLSREHEVFQAEDIRLMTAVANQIASAIQNAALFSLIREQAEKLGLMVRSQQVESSKSRAILDSIADGVIVTDDNHTITLFNPAAERILGLKYDEVVGTSVFNIMGVYGPAGRRWSETIKTWKDTPPKLHTVEDHTDKITLEDQRVISIHPAPVILGDEFLGTVSIFRDITRDIEVDRLKSEFVATVSHELRTPMTSIKGFVDLMLMGASGALNDEQRRFLDIVQTNTERLEILVNDLLDISRIEAGKIVLRMGPIDVESLIHDVESYLAQLQREEGKPMRVRIDFPDRLPEIWGDMERVRQIISNIAENSFYYTPAGGTITIGASHTGDEVEIVIADNGIGISLSEQERIFERFFRGEQALNMGVAGTGLGLSIALNLIGMHEGRIWVSSEGIPGKGTTFTVAFPIVGERVEFA